MTALDDYQKLRSKMERVERERNQLSGAYLQLMTELRKEYGSKTLEEAERKLTNFKREIRILEREFEILYKKFEKKWNSQTIEEVG